MERLHAGFANYLGKNILHSPNKGENRELLLDGVHLSHLVCYNGKTDPITVAIDECFILLGDKSEVQTYGLPLFICKIKKGDKYISENIVEKKTDQQIMDMLVNLLCSIQNITRYDFFYKKTRKREYTWARQIYTSCLHLLAKHSLASAGRAIGIDHSTVLHSSRKLKEFLEYDKEYREHFRKVFVFLKEEYGDKIECLGYMGWL